MTNFLIMIGAALAYAIGGIFMKLSQGWTSVLPTLAVYTLFLTGATLQIFSMNRGELGITYIVVLALEAVLALGFGIFFFKEHQSLTKYMAVALIVTGISLLRSAE